MFFLFFISPFQNDPSSKEKEVTKYTKGTYFGGKENNYTIFRT